MKTTQTSLARGKISTFTATNISPSKPSDSTTTTNVVNDRQQRINSKRRYLSTTLMMSMIIGLMVMFNNTTIQAQAYPVPLTSSSFNTDIIAENSPPSQYITAPTPAGYALYTTTYPNANGTGMPTSNTISNGTVTYDIQPYNANNAWLNGQSRGKV